MDLRACSSVRRGAEWRGLGLRFLVSLLGTWLLQNREHAKHGSRCREHGFLLVLPVSLVSGTSRARAQEMGVVEGLSVLVYFSLSLY